MCRGAKWTDRKWPIMRGKKSLQDCANSCGRTRGCTAFDVSGGSEGSDCMLYGHKHPVPAPGVPGECYTVPGAVYVEEVHQAQPSPASRPRILQEEDEDYTNIGRRLQISYLSSWIIQKKWSYLERVRVEGKDGRMDSGRWREEDRVWENVLTSVRRQQAAWRLTSQIKMEGSMTACCWATPQSCLLVVWLLSVTSYTEPDPSCQR